MLDAEQLRQFHRRHGEPYRYWKGVKAGSDNLHTSSVATREGRIYVEQTINSAWRALVFQTDEDTHHEQYGFLRAGQALFSVMTNELGSGLAVDYPGATVGDRFMATEAVRREYVEVTRTAGTNFDILPHAQYEGMGASNLLAGAIAAIYQVRKEATVYTATTDYVLELSSGVATGRIQWIGSKPTDNAKYAIDYGIRRVYEMERQHEKTAFLDKNGTRLPQWCYCNFVPVSN